MMDSLAHSRHLVLIDDPEAVGKLTPPEARTQADNAVKDPGEMRLITHSAGDGNLAQ
jgi:hypothetical protein